MVRELRGVIAAVAIVAVAGVGLVAGSGQTLGKGVAVKEATPLAALYATPEKFVGKTIRIDGVVVGVCEEMGCWMALGASEKAEDSIRLKVSHHGGIVFPVSAKGKQASAEGVFELVAANDKESKSTIAEQAAVMKVTDFSKKYQINATGVVIK